MSRTKLVAVLTFLSAIIGIAVDLMNGGGFDIKSHSAEIMAASGSLGLFFLRDSIQKVMEAVESIKAK